MRYNSTERIGVNATESIFIREFDWIFRDQPIVDVGIDVLVEQSKKGNPTGKFIALQIKSGKGNFSISSNKLTYYISNVHYNYWLNFDIPILLIAHVPETNSTYWQEISYDNIKKTKKKWKIEIPKKNKLNLKAKPLITKLLTKKDVSYKSIKIFKGEDIDSQTIYDIVEKSYCIADSNESIGKTANLLGELSKKVTESNEKFKHFNEIGQSFKSPQVIAVVNTYAKNLNIYAKRFENENQIFSETFGEGFFGYEQAIMIHYLFLKDPKFVMDSIKSVEKIPQSINNAINSIEFMNKNFSSIPSLNNNFKLAKTNMKNVVDVLLVDYKVAKSIIENLIQTAKSLL